MAKWSWVRLTAVPLLCNDSRQVVHSSASVTKQYNLVPAKGWWCSVVGKVTTGLVKVTAAGFKTVTCLNNEIRFSSNACTEHGTSFTILAKRQSRQISAAMQNGQHLLNIDLDLQGSVQCLWSMPVNRWPCTVLFPYATSVFIITPIRINKWNRWICNSYL